MKQRKNKPVDRIGEAWQAMTPQEQQALRRRAARARVSIYDLLAQDLAQQRKRQRKEQESRQ